LVGGVKLLQTKVILKLDFMPLMVELCQEKLEQDYMSIIQMQKEQMLDGNVW